MKIAIMQPYIFPYIGYFQLIASVDKFIFYDDVAYIKNGWINRNRILVEKKEHLFTFPVKNGSCNTKINRVELDKFNNVAKKILKTIEQSYRKAPYFDHVYPVINNVLSGEYNLISDLAKASILAINDYVSLKPDVVISSNIYKNDHLSSQERVIDINLIEKSTAYINSDGGRILYSHDSFKSNNIDLMFIKASIHEYQQHPNMSFVPSLSIIDVLMFNDVETVINRLHGIELTR